MSRSLYILLFALTCSFIYPAGIEKANWLIGTWEQKSARGSMYETWTKVSDKELSGKSYRLQQKDSIVFETIRLLEDQQGIWYIPVVKDQNDGAAVRFSLKEMTANSMVFENLQHDFPQRITYQRISADSLLAEISGNKNGQLRKQQFPMHRLR